MKEAVIVATLIMSVAATHAAYMRGIGRAPSWLADRTSPAPHVACTLAAAGCAEQSDDWSDRTP